MRVYVIDDYRSRDVFHPKGTILEVPPEVATWLMVDAPGCFSLFPRGDRVSIETAVHNDLLGKDYRAPADKMVRKGRVK
jgi:hypothetical protein